MGITKRPSVDPTLKPGKYSTTGMTDSQIIVFGFTTDYEEPRSGRGSDSVQIWVKRLTLHSSIHKSFSLLCFILCVGVSC